MKEGDFVLFLFGGREYFLKLKYILNEYFVFRKGNCSDWHVHKSLVKILAFQKDVFESYKD